MSRTLTPEAAATTPAADGPITVCGSTYGGSSGAWAYLIYSTPVPGPDLPPSGGY